ncbi:MAG: hypothetical protein RL497_2420 [Pseudomonadota bacterium]|jgi:hypothetical protein
MKLQQHALITTLVAFLAGCNGTPVQDQTPVTKPAVNETSNTGRKIKETREETLWIDHHQGWYNRVFPSIDLSFCLIGTENSEPVFTGEEKCIAPSITGFSYQQGYLYKLKLKKIIFETLADAPSYAYELISVEEKIPATPGKSFETIIRPSPYLTFDNDSIYLKYNYKINCLPDICDLIADGLWQPNVSGILVEAEYGSDLTEPYLITAVKTVLVSQPR